MESSASPPVQHTSNATREVVVGMLFVGLLFFILGFVTWLNGSLIPFLKVVCKLSNFQALLVTFAFYIAYTVMALLSAAVLKRTGYKMGMSLGLGIMGIGPRESAAMRISIMGLFNKGAGIVVPLIFTSLMLKNIDTASEAALAQRLVFPYACMAAALFVIMAFIHFSKLRKIPPELDGADAGVDATSVLQFPQLVLGALALFGYVGVEVIAGDTIGLYGHELKVANFGVLGSYTMVCMVIGYLIGVVAIPRFMSQQRALVLSGLAGVLLTIGVTTGSTTDSALSQALLGWSGAPLVPDSVMFLALLVMAIAGGALLPLLYGHLADIVTPRSAYWLLLPCYALILWYAASGHKIRRWR